MAWLQAAVLGLVQGLTEFIPVSSDGHLFAVRALLHWPDQGLLFDTVLHLGTLVAVVVGLWPEWVRVGRGVASVFRTRQLWKTSDQRLVVLVLVATVPGAVFGYFGESIFADVFRTTSAVALLFTVCGLFYVLAEYLARRATHRDEPSLLGALAIGAAQATALLPGVSRSGTTIAAGRLLGLERASAARFSFVLAGPIVAGAVAKSLLELAGAPAVETAWGPLVVGVVVAGVVGVLAIRWLLRFLKTRSLLPFGVYMVVVGGVLLLARTVGWA